MGHICLAQGNGRIEVFGFFWDSSSGQVRLFFRFRQDLSSFNKTLREGDVYLSY